MLQHAKNMAERPLDSAYTFSNASLGTPCFRRHPEQEKIFTALNKQDFFASNGWRRGRDTFRYVFITYCITAIYNYNLFNDK